MTEPTVPVRRAAVAFILITVLLDMLALGMIIPVLPKLIEAFRGGDPVRLHVDPRDPGRSVRWGDESGQEAHRRRLARPVGTEEGDHLAPGD